MHAELCGQLVGEGRSCLGEHGLAGPEEGRRERWGVKHQAKGKEGPVPWECILYRTQEEDSRPGVWGGEKLVWTRRRAVISGDELSAAVGERIGQCTREVGPPFLRALGKSDPGWEGPGAHSAASMTGLAGHSKLLKETWD